MCAVQAHIESLIEHYEKELEFVPVFKSKENYDNLFKIIMYLFRLPLQCAQPSYGIVPGHFWELN